MQTRKDALLYASTSASLYNFLGSSAPRDHMKTYNSVVSQALKAHQDLVNFGAEELTVIDPFFVLAKAREQACIFITFHTGSFNLLVSHLLKSGRQFYVLSDTQSMGNKDYNEATERYRQEYKNECSLEMLNVEEPKAIFNIIRKIREGASMVGFLDGNKGVDGQSKTNENLLDVNFLNGKVKVRKGLPYMAFITKTPVVLALNYEVKGKKYLRIYEPITAEEDDKEAFCIRTISTVFSHFGDHIVNHIDQWANWPYLHNWTDLDFFRNKLDRKEKNTEPSIGEEGSLTFNSDRFCPIRLDGELFLFDRVHYHLLPVEETHIPIFSYKTDVKTKEHFIKILAEKQQQEVSTLIAKKDTGKSLTRRI